MKKIIYIFFLFIMIFPKVVFASNNYTYTEAIDKSKRYITDFKGYDRYIIKDTGDLLLYNDYMIISNSKNNYLSTDLYYWLKADTNKRIVKLNKAMDVDNNTKSHVRVTELLESEVEVTGNGTYSNPWVFTNIYKVYLYTNSKGYLSLSNENNNLTKYSAYLNSGDSINIYLFPDGINSYLSNSCGLKYENDHLVIENLSKDMYCQIIFDEEKYTVTLDSNGGKLNESNTFEVLYNQKYNYYGIDLPQPEAKDNYLFAGWYTEKEKGEEINDETIVSIRKNHTLYAHYIEKQNNRCNIAKTIDGYTFDGWYTTKDSKGQKVITSTGNLLANVSGYTDENRNWIKSSASTLYAKYITNEYIVKFNCNGGTGDSTQTFKYDKAQNLNANTCIKTGYTFKGWSLSEEDNTVKYKNSQSVSKLTPDGEIELYAVWSTNKYKVTFNGNGATSNIPSSINITYDDNITTTLKTPIKKGYLFDGWYTSKENGIKIIDSNGKLVKNIEGYTDSNGNWKYTNNITVYAMWIQKPYTVSFDCNGGSGSMESVTFNSNEQKSIPANTCTKIENDFLGWSKDKNATTATYIDKYNTKNGNIATAEEENVILYAIYKVHTYTITLNANSGTIGTKSVNVSYESQKLSIAKLPTKSGYTLVGWCIDKECTMKVANADGTFIKNISKYTNSNGEWIYNNKLTLYATWDIGVYTITLDNNEATEEGTTSLTIKTGDTTLTEILNPKRTGYIFEGWYTAKTSGSKVIDIDGNLVSNVSGWVNKKGVWIKDATAGVTLYARWSKIKYTIKYNGNGSTSGKMSDSTHEYDTEKSLTSNAYARTGYSFKEWNTNESGTGDSYSNKEKVKNLSSTNNDSINLYLIWNPNTYTLTFNANGGVLDTKTVNAIYDSSELPEIKNPTRSGYTFIGWYTKTSSGLEIINADGTLKKDVSGYTDNDGKWINTSSITLYAIWTANTYNVELDNNNPTSYGTKEIEVTYASSVLPTISIPKKTGYTFSGWVTEKNGSSIIITSNGKFKASVKNYTDSNSKWIKNEDATLYAKWTANTYTITFNKNGGTLNTTKVTATYDSNILSTIKNPTLKDYQFTGWYTNTELTTKVIDSSGAFVKNVLGYTDYYGNWVKDENITLYAGWEKKSYTVVLDCNGGIGNKQYINFEGDESKTLPSNICTKIENTFIGWSKDENATNKAYADKAKVSKLGSSSEEVVLYAVWSPNTYTVKLNLNGGSSGSTSVKIPYGSKKATIATLPKKSGYTLLGWYTSQTNGIKVLNSDGTIEKNITGISNSNGEWISTKNNLITLYAQWTNAAYTVTLNGNNSTEEGTNSFSILYQSSDIPTIINPKKTGYIFSGWQTSSAGGNIVINIDGSLNNVSGWVSNKQWINKNTSQTLYAKWTAIKYTIKYDGNGSTSGSTSNSSYTYDTAKALSENKYQKTGYTFIGWSKTKTGEVIYTNSQKVKNLTTKDGDTITLYAQWTPNKYKITLNANGGTGGTSSVQATYNSSSLPVINNPLKSNTEKGINVSVTYIDEDGNPLSDEVSVGTNLKTGTYSPTVKDYSGNEHICQFEIKEYKCNSYQVQVGSYPCSIPCGTTRTTIPNSSILGSGHVNNYQRVSCSGWCDKYETRYKTCYK